MKPESFEYWNPDKSVKIITGTFLEGEDSRGDFGLGKLVEYRFKAPRGTTSFSITTHHHRDNVTTPHVRPKHRRRLSTAMPRGEA